jgi:large subunit ribosomal protein L6
MSTEAHGAFRSSLTVPVPNGVTVKADGHLVHVKGPLGQLDRDFPTEAIELAPKKGEVELTLKVPPNRKKAKALLNTWERHLGNMIQGTTHGFEAKLKSVAAHFPMKLQVKDRELVIENFLGEKYPRSAHLVEGVNAEVQGEFVVLSGVDIEKVGRAAATIERTTHIRDYDPRVFQDGIYIVERAHPKVA